MMYDAFLVAAAGEPSNNSAVTVALITVFGVIATVLGSFFASRYAAKKSADAAKDTVKVTEKQVDFGALDGIVKNLQAEAKRLGERVKELEDRDQEKQHSIDDLQRLINLSDTKYRVAITYVRDIILWTKLVLNSDRTPPTAPVEIADDLKV